MNKPDMSDWDRNPETTTPVKVSRPLSFNRSAVKPADEVSASEIDAAVESKARTYPTETYDMAEARRKRNDKFVKYICTRQGNDELADLIAGGVDLDARDHQGNGLLHVAVASRNLTALAHLIRAGADMHAKNNDGITPLIAAAAGYNAEAAGVMLAQSDPDLSAHTFDGVHALHIAAASFSKQRLVEVLLERGVSPVIEDGEGKTPLYYAVAAKTEAAEVICMAGGFREKDREKLQEAIAAPEKYGKEWDWNLLFDYAAKFKDGALEKNFPKRGAELPPLLDLATQEIFTAAENSGGSGFAMEKYFEDPRIHARDYENRTPLMAGCDGKFRSLWDVRAIAWRSDPKARSNSGRTVLHYVAHHVSPADSIISAQIGRADVNAQDIFGVTPLMVTASDGCNHVDTFMQNGADPFTRNLLGMTAMDMAKVRKCEYTIGKLAELTKKHGWEDGEKSGRRCYKKSSYTP